MKPAIARAATAAELPAGAAAPGEVVLLPAGALPTRPHDRREGWTNDDPEGVVRRTAEHGVDLVIDWEHSTTKVEERGGEAPAAGWLRDFRVRDGAVVASAEWTPRARAQIEAREYRYLSPVFAYDPATRVPLRIDSAALTNDPSLYMRALARAHPDPEKESDMDLAKLRKALGLAATAGEAEILAAAAARHGAAGELSKIAAMLGVRADAEPATVTTAATAFVAGSRGIARAAGLAEDAKLGDVQTAVAAAKAAASANGTIAPDPSLFVPRAEFDAVRTRLEGLEIDSAATRAKAAVDAAVSAGKVTPGSREWALAYAAKDPEGFAKYVDAAPTILAGGRVAPATPGDGGGDTLTDDERAACRAMGLAEKDFLESKKALAKAGAQEG